MFKKGLQKKLNIQIVNSQNINLKLSAIVELFYEKIRE